MKLKRLSYNLTVCKLLDIHDAELNDDFFFIGRTDEEISYVCKTDNVPQRVLERDDGWRAFRIQGILDFSLIGILAKISTILAENMIGIFAISTYNTDYIMVKEKNFETALDVLAKAGYEVV